MLGLEEGKALLRAEGKMTGRVGSNSMQSLSHATLSWPAGPIPVVSTTYSSEGTLCPGEGEAGSVGNADSFEATTGGLDPGLPESSLLLGTCGMPLLQLPPRRLSPFTALSLPATGLPAQNPSSRVDFLRRRAERSTQS